MPGCKQINQTGKRKGLPCDHDPLAGQEYCRQHTPLTMEQKAALEIVDLIEADLGQYGNSVIAKLKTNKLRQKISAREPDRSLMVVLLKTGLLPAAEKAENITQFARGINELIQRQLEPLRAISKDLYEWPALSAEDYPLQLIPEIDVLMRAASDGRVPAHWKTDVQTNTLTYALPDLPSHFVQLMLSDQDREEGVDLQALSRLVFEQDADAAFAMLYVCRVLTSLLPLPAGAIPVLPIELDVVMERIGWDARGTLDRQEKRAKIWDYLCFGARAGVFGKRSGVSQDRESGELIPTEIDEPIWAFFKRERPVQPSLLATDRVPLSVEIGLSPTWTRLLTDPRTAQYLTGGEIVGSISGNQPSGAWARCLGLTLAKLWGSHPRLALLGEIRPTRRELLTRYTPKINPPMDVLASDHPIRAQEYTRQAIGILVTTGFLERPLTPDGDIKPKPAGFAWPRKDWQNAWLDERVSLLPGPAMQMAIQDAANAIPLPALRPLISVKRGRGRPRKGSE